MSHHFILSIKSKRRQLDPECEFFLAANVERYNSFRKRKPSADSWVDDSSTTSDFLVEYTFKCVEAGCCQEFMSIRKYEEHKFKCHSHQCSVCSRSFTSDRLLSFHISELHDSYFAAASKKKPMYACLVENCQEVFWSDQERRLHLIKQHHFHASYDFHDPKKFLRKFQQKLALNHKGEAHMNVDFDPPSEVTSRMPNSKIVLTVVASSALPGGNRAQRRAQKRHEYETITSGTGGAVHPAGLSSDTSVTDMKSTDLGNDVGEFRSNCGAIVRTIDHHVESPQSSTATEPCGPLNEPDSVYYEAGSSSVDEMQVDDGLDQITQGMRKTSIHVPSKISFGRRKVHH